MIAESKVNVAEIFNKSSLGKLNKSSHFEKEDEKCNALNSSDDLNYLYKARDITMIQYQLMKHYLGDFVVNQPIGNDESNEAILEYLIQVLMIGTLRFVFIISVIITGLSLLL